MNSSIIKHGITLGCKTYGCKIIRGKVMNVRGKKIYTRKQ